MERLSATIQNEFPKKRIVIVGDLVADQFLHGTIARVSREVPGLFCGMMRPTRVQGPPRMLL